MVHTANIQSLEYFHYELNQSLDSIKALILFRVAPSALSHRPRICMLHVMNGENGKMTGACTF